jgi:putative ABC transport system permease protein
LRASLKLARWEARQTGGLLFVTGIGIVLAVVFICTIPLYAQIAVSAGIRNALNSTSGGPYIAVSSVSYQPTTGPINQIQQQITQQVDHTLGSFTDGPAQFSLQMTDNPILASPHFYPNSQINLIGVTPQEAAPHLTLMAGRLPTITHSANDIEIAITSQTAKALNAVVGSKLRIQAFQVTGGDQPASNISIYATLHVVGIFQLPAQTDPYWHGEDFHIAEVIHCFKPCPPFPIPPLFQALAANNGLMNAFGSIPTRVYTYYEAPGSVTYISTPLLYWYYHIDASQVNIASMNTLVNRIKNVLGNLSNSPINPPFVDQTQAVGPYTPLVTYSNYVNALFVPASGLTILLLALVLYFVSVMTSLIVERRAVSIATLRSRGANRRQVLSLFAFQASGMALVALIVGPLLSIGAVYLLVRSTLPPTEQGAINLITSQPAQVAAQLLEYALVAVAIALFAMLVALYQAANANIVQVRRASARASRAPFWQRVRLDLVAGLLAIAGYIIVIYVASPGVLGPRARTLALAPLTLAGAAFLLIGGILLFLRGFPLFLELLSRLALRGRSAAPTLALAQMARAPRQAIRTMMLLAFATAFIIFALVFNASQAQRLQDTVTFQTGADFSGDISYLSSIVPSSAFSRLPGVAAASTGYVATDQTVGANPLDIALMAVDTDTFARTVTWTNQDGVQSPAALMGALNRASDALNRAPTGASVPAIIDNAAAQSMQVSVGSHFTLSDVNGKLGFTVIAIVQHIPTIVDTTANDTGEDLLAGGVLVDFRTYNALMTAINNVTYTSTTVWVKAQNNPSAAAEVYRELATGANSITVENINDTRAIVSSLQSDPLYITILTMLIAGALAALLLALIGSLVASWQSARSRLTSFAVLRALGGARRQIASVLLWEQGILYTTALALGALFGVLLSLLALPTLIFTSVGSGAAVSTGQFYLLQSEPPVQVVIPWTLWLALAILVAVCAIAIWMMVRIVSRPSMSQTLRLNED